MFYFSDTTNVLFLNAASLLLNTPYPSIYKVFEDIITKKKKCLVLWEASHASPPSPHYLQCWPLNASFSNQNRGKLEQAKYGL
jgi:hypothetical protein